MADVDIDLTTTQIHPVYGERGNVVCLHDGLSSAHLGAPRSAEGAAALRRLARVVDALADGMVGSAGRTEAERAAAD